MRRLPRLAIVGLPLLALACAAPPVEPQVTLPPTAATEGAGDPTRGAILASAYVFGQPQSVAGNPAAAAEALAQLEYLTAELASGPRWRDMDPTVPMAFARARSEARAAFGLDPAAPPQRAIDSLYGTAAALRAADRTRAASSLAALTGPAQAEPTLRRLAALPYLPQAAFATSRAQTELNRRDRGRDFRPFFR